MIPERSMLASAAAFASWANYCALALLYLRQNVDLSRSLQVSDIKPRALGHWGCVPGLTFIWACLSAAVRATGTDVRPFWGTGHAGPAWAACSFLEAAAQGDFTRNSTVVLEQMCAEFGRNNGLMTELGSRYRGVLWPSGELGYCLGIAQGHSFALSEAQVAVAVLGDGELETAPTCGSLFSTINRHSGSQRLIVVINANQYRMGSRSELAKMSRDQIASLFSALGFTPVFIRGFDFEYGILSFTKALRQANRDDIVPILFVENLKGADVPPVPTKADDVAAPIGHHKPPLRRIDNAQGLAWLQQWLDQYRTAEMFVSGELNVNTIRDCLPPSPLLLSNVARRILMPSQATTVSEVNGPEPLGTDRPLDIVCKLIAQHMKARRVLVTSPDELYSNRLQALHLLGVPVLERLSEHQCIMWAIGFCIAGGCAWFATYEGFSSTVLPAIVQYLRFEDSNRDPCITYGPVNILLTSIGWRNVYTHQDPGFVTSLLEHRFDRLRCFTPVTTRSITRAVNQCHKNDNGVNCLLLDKEWKGSQDVARGIELGFVQRIGIEAGPRHFEGSEVTFIVVGGYLAREAVCAAALLNYCYGAQRADVLILEETTWLYRGDQSSCELRQAAIDQVRLNRQTVVVCSFYSDAISGLLMSALGRPFFNIHAFRASDSAVSPVAMLVQAKCSWIQLAASALRGVTDSPDAPGTLGILESTLQKLDELLERLTESTCLSYEDPEWYYTVTPDHPSITEL